MKFKEICLDDIFSFPSINSGITEKFINDNKGDIPVYSSKKNGSPIGHIKNNLPIIKYFNNCLSWNRNGSVGYTFYRDHKFVTTDDHRPMIIKSEYTDFIDYEFLRFIVQDAIFANGFAWDNKAGKEKIKLIYISIPIKDDNTFDLEQQKILAKKYKNIEKIKQKINDYLITLNNCQIQINKDIETNYVNIELKSIGDFIKGNSKYTSKYCHNNSGIYPVYSANTKGKGIIGNIASYDYECECLKITTNGYYAGTVKYLNCQKFSINGDTGIFKINKPNVEYKYLEFILRNIRNNYGYGWENKPKKEDIESINIPIPIKFDGSFDMEKQKKIAQKYKNIEHKHTQTIDMLKRIQEEQVKIVFD